MYLTPLPRLPLALRFAFYVARRLHAAAYRFHSGLHVPADWLEQAATDRLNLGR